MLANGTKLLAAINELFEDSVKLEIERIKNDNPDPVKRKRALEYFSKALEFAKSNEYKSVEEVRKALQEYFREKASRERQKRIEHAIDLIKEENPDPETQKRKIEFFLKAMDFAKSGKYTNREDLFSAVNEYLKEAASEDNLNESK